MHIERRAAARLSFLLPLLRLHYAARERNNGGFQHTGQRIVENGLKTYCHYNF